MSGIVPEHKVGTDEDPLAIAARQLSELREYKRARRILLIEDDAGMQMLFGRKVANFNCEVTYTSDGNAGIYQALNFPFDLIIIDIALTPDGPDGIAVFRAIRSQRKDEPSVVFFTGRIDGQKMRDIEQIGFAPLIPKPMNPSEHFFASFMHAFRIEEKTK